MPIKRILSAPFIAIFLLFGCVNTSPLPSAPPPRLSEILNWPEDEFVAPASSMAIQNLSESKCKVTKIHMSRSCNDKPSFKQVLCGNRSFIIQTKYNPETGECRTIEYGDKTLRPSPDNR